MMLARGVSVCCRKRLIGPKTPTPQPHSKGCKVANVCEFFLAEPVQFFLCEAAYSNQVGEDGRQHRISVIESRIDRLAPIVQIMLQCPKFAGLLNLRSDSLCLLDDSPNSLWSARSNACRASFFSAGDHFMSRMLVDRFSAPE